MLVVVIIYSESLLTMKVRLLFMFVFVEQKLIFCFLL